ncbi:MAG TPA: chloramphenicol acetyltransferase [Candidatus Ozemobacteraceae bacterium]
MKYIDIDTWKRKEHFRHFCGLDDPYWGLSTAMDATGAWRAAKEFGGSFFLRYLHASLIAANDVEELRMRILGGKVVCYDRVHGSATVLRPDETFGCCFIEFSEDFPTFAREAAARMAETKARSGMCIDQNDRLDQIYYSSIPWQSFTGLTYSKSLHSEDSVPRITFGKLHLVGDRQMLPVSIQVHHGLVDGLHVARFLDRFQAILNG